MSLPKPSSTEDLQLALLSIYEPMVQEDKNDIQDYEITTAPVFTQKVIDYNRDRGIIIPQYGLLGQYINCLTPAQDHSSMNSVDNISVSDSNIGDTRIYLNSNAPWSAFICGVQGSGKSHSLACILGNSSRIIISLFADFKREYAASNITIRIIDHTALSTSVSL